jgi:hypothetical protein
MNFIPAKGKAYQRKKKFKSPQNEKSAIPEERRRFW